MIRKTLLVGTTALALVLNPAQARADPLSDIMDAVTKGYEGDMDGLMWQLLGYFDIYGSSLCSYLNVGRNWLGTGHDWFNFGRECLDRLFPAVPEWLTVDENAEYAAMRQEDRASRIEEALSVANGVVSQQPLNQLKLTTLQAANVSPVSLFAAIQIGNEIEAESVLATHKMNGLLAELGQVEMDQRMAEDWQRVQAASLAEAHYDDGFWSGQKSWQPETIETGW